LVQTTEPLLFRYRTAYLRSARPAQSSSTTTAAGSCGVGEVLVKRLFGEGF